MSIITLGNIRAKEPCAPGWAKLTETLGTTNLAVELSIGDILIANGRSDALWALRCLPPREAVAAVMPAVKRASVHTTDQRVHDCIAAVDSWLAGDDSVDLKTSAVAEAWVAAAAAAAEAALRDAWAAEAARAAMAAARAAGAVAASAEAALRDAWAAEAAAAAMAAARAAVAAAAAAKAAESAAAKAAESAESAEWAEWAAEAAAAAAERDMQASDLLAMFPPIRLKAEVAA